MMVGGHWAVGGTAPVNGALVDLMQPPRNEGHLGEMRADSRTKSVYV